MYSEGVCKSISARHLYLPICLSMYIGQHPLEWFIDWIKEENCTEEVQAWIKNSKY